MLKLGKVIAVVTLTALLAAVIALMVAGRPADASTGPGKPAMGYNTWYEYGAGITESRVVAQAQLMASGGLVAAGYDTMNLDDAWQAPARTSAGVLTWDVSKFPHGLPWLAKRLALLGMKLGIYTAIGTQTCARMPGSFGHYSQDAAAFASWGVTFVKVDDCGGLPAGTSLAGKAAYFHQFGVSVKGDGMLYSDALPVLLPVGSDAWYSAVYVSSKDANMWRMTPDEHWLDTAQTTIMGHLNADLPLHGYAGPGRWNDLDMLVPGVVDAHPFGWTPAQARSQMSVWAQEASPLLISTNLAKLPNGTLNDLKNPHLIAIDQSGSQAPVSLVSNGILAVLKGADGGISVLLANEGTRTAHTVFTLPQLHVYKGPHRPYVNVWTGATGTISGVSVTLAPGATALLVIR